MSVVTTETVAIETAAPVRRRRSLHTLLGGAPAFPVGVLALVTLLEQIDQATLGVVLPDIRADLHFSVADLTWITIPPALLAYALVFPSGWLGDRVNRVLLTLVCAVLFAVSTVLNGVVTTFAAFVVLRTASTLIAVSLPAQGSLLADYYPAQGRGFASAIYKGSTPIGYLLGSLAAGVLATQLGWRAAFFVLSIPAAVAVVFLLRLKEPPRGRYDYDQATLAFASGITLGPIQSLKALFNVRSFRRLMVASALIGLGNFTLLPLAVFYFQGAFGLDDLGRGVITAVDQVAVLGAGLAGGVFLQKLSQSLVTRINGYLISVVGIAYLLLALAPTVPLAAAAWALGGAAFGVFSVGVFLQTAATAPANLRSMAFAGFAIFGLLGIVWAPIAFGIAAHGYRLGILASFVWYVVGGLVVADGSRYVDRDIARANVVVEAEAEARRRRASGEAVDLLEVKGLDVAYGNVQVLFSVDMVVRDGELVALLGTNGAGKSTLLRTVSGLIRPTEGVVLLEGSDVTGLDAEIITARGVIHVPGGRGVFPDLTVEHNLRMGSYLLRHNPIARQAAIEHALSFFPALSGRLSQLAGSLSGGEQQMLNLAQALMSRPRLLLIDELSLGLAPKVVEELLRVVERIRESGVTIILVEQSVNIALQLADRAYFMEKGEVRFEGRAADLADRDDLVRSVFLAGAR